MSRHRVPVLGSVLNTARLYVLPFLTTVYATVLQIALLLVLGKHSFGTKRRIPKLASVLDTSTTISTTNITVGTSLELPRPRPGHSAGTRRRVPTLGLQYTYKYIHINR